MFYTVQELAAMIKAWEYYIAILFLAIFIVFWQLLSRESRRRRSQPVRIAPQSLQGRLVEGARDSTGSGLRPRATPCWETKQCPPEVRKDCPAYVMNPVPCWVARPLVTGKPWERCASCPVHTKGMERLVEAVKKGPPDNTFPEAARWA